jgi:hypothetical protein
MSNEKNNSATSYLDVDFDVISEIQPKLKFCKNVSTTETQESSQNSIKEDLSLVKKCDSESTLSKMVDVLSFELTRRKSMSKKKETKIE